jgi:hypothetical protein
MKIDEIRRIQKLAGIITESQYHQLKEVDENQMSFFNEIWDEQSKEYSALVGTDPIYDGLDKVANDPSVKQSALEWAQGLSNEDDDEDDMFNAYAQDGIDYTIMREFAPQLASNLVKVGFKYDKDEEYWSIPSAYLNKLDKSRQEVYKNGATSYGIIWDFFNYDYDTSPRETISDYLDEAAQDM